MFKLKAKQLSGLKHSLMFFVLALVFSSVLAAVGVYFKLHQATLVLLYSFGVVLAVFVLRGMDSVHLGNLKNGLYLYFLAVFLPILYIGSLFLINKELVVFSLDVAIVLRTSLLFILISAFFEEVGWRGYLFDYLKSFSWWQKNILIGLFWGFWHFPAIFAGSYNVGSSVLLGILFFVLNVVLLSFIIGWFRVKTGGVIGASLMHTFHNLAYLWIGGAFNLNESELLIVGESSWRITIALIVVILVLQAWREPKKA